MAWRWVLRESLALPTYSSLSVFALGEGPYMGCFGMGVITEKGPFLLVIWRAAMSTLTLCLYALSVLKNNSSVHLNKKKHSFRALRL